jgi:hypothetical protein
MQYQMEGKSGPEQYVYQAGIAAHAILQAIGEQTNRRNVVQNESEMAFVAHEIASNLISEGRKFEHWQDPPLPPERVWEGRDVALDYATAYPPVPGPKYEHGMSVNEKWEPVSYSSKARLRCIADVVWRESIIGEESVVETLLVRDYKSAWSTGAGATRTLQMKVQAVLADIHFPGAHVLTLEVVNLRTRGTIREELYLGDEGRTVLDEWRRDLEGTMRALDEQREPTHSGQIDTGEGIAYVAHYDYPAIPGHGCAGCPYLTICDEANEWLVKHQLDTPEDGARKLVIIEAERARLRDWLKRATDESPIDIGDALVGTVGRDTKTPADGAYSRAWDEWELHGGDGPGFALACKLTSGNLEQLAKTLYPGKDGKTQRDEFLADNIGTKVMRRFGTWPK